MPVIFQEKIDASLTTEVWNFTESEAFLLSQLTLNDHDKRNILSLQLPKRRLEKLACRMALQDILHLECPTSDLTALTYSQTGAPQLPPHHLSFSHSTNYAAVAFSPTQPVGIDIEKIGHRLENVYSHFMNEEEISQVDCHNANLLHYYWGAKEALYKLHSTGHLDYQTDIHILPYESQQGYLLVDGQKTNYHLIHREIDGNCLVIAIAE